MDALVTVTRRRSDSQRQIQRIGAFTIAQHRIPFCGRHTIEGVGSRARIDLAKAGPIIYRGLENVAG